MVDIKQLYLSTVYSVGDISKDIYLQPANFVMLYNKEASKWLSEKIELTKKDNRLNEAQYWLMNESPLKEESKDLRVVYYKLPNDYLSFVSSSSLAQKEKCTRTINNYLVKPFNKNLLFQDSFEQPNYEWEEGFCILSKDRLGVYFTNFSLVRTYMSYYRQMEDVDIEGYVHVDGSPSKTINPGYNKQIAQEICDRVIQNIHAIYKNQLGYEMFSQTVQKDQLT